MDNNKQVTLDYDSHRRVRRSLKGKILHAILNRWFPSRSYKIKLKWWESTWEKKICRWILKPLSPRI